LILLSILQKGTQVEGSKSSKMLQETHDNVMKELKTFHHELRPKLEK
jgi:hypothetical protein